MNTAEAGGVRVRSELASRVYNPQCSAEMHVSNHFFRLQMLILVETYARGEVKIRFVLCAPLSEHAKKVLRFSGVLIQHCEVKSTVHYRFS